MSRGSDVSEACQAVIAALFTWVGTGLEPGKRNRHAPLTPAHPWDLSFNSSEKARESPSAGDHVGDILQYHACNDQKLIKHDCEMFSSQCETSVSHVWHIRVCQDPHTLGFCVLFIEYRLMITCVSQWNWNAQVYLVSNLVAIAKWMGIIYISTDYLISLLHLYQSFLAGSWVNQSKLLLLQLGVNSQIQRVQETVFQYLSWHNFHSLQTYMWFTDL